VFTASNNSSPNNECHWNKLQRAEGGRIPEQTNHAVFQLTGALRNVAGEERALPLLVSRGAIAALCRTMELFAGDLDLITNIARTLR